MNYATILKEATERLMQAEIDNAAGDAFALMEHCFSINRSKYYLIARDEMQMDASHLRHYQELVEQRANHVPLQYLTHVQNFCGLDFYVDERVLIPRQDTEVLVERVLMDWRNLDGLRILDLCTGSGCILISLMALLDTAWGVGVDISKDALAVARCNEVNNKASIRGKVDWIQSDLTETLGQLEGFMDEKFDIIVSNPPYITKTEMEELSIEVKGHEPHLALYGPEDGLYFYKRIAKEGRAYLKDAGSIYFEIGCTQGEAVRNILLENGFVDVCVLQDLAGLDRVVCGKKA